MRTHHRGCRPARRRHRAERQPLPARHRLEVPEAGKREGRHDHIDPDAHSAEGLVRDVLRRGIARKGWQEQDDVLNTRVRAEVMAFFGRLRDEKGH